MKKVIYFDCYMGISGDMVLGACLDLGVDLDVLKKELSKLHVNGFDVTAKKIVKNGFSGTDAEVILTEDGLPCDYSRATAREPRRTYQVINDIIMNSELDDSVKRIAHRILCVIAEAEAKVHGKPIEDVAFHEVGALDSIVDICGAAICLNLLGVEQVYCSELREGTGFIMCQRGPLPIPVPAVVNMLPGSNITIKQTEEIRTELVTPTGFGILKGTEAICGPMPAMRVESIGIGFGKRDTGRLNGLRAILGSMEEDENSNTETSSIHTHLSYEEHKIKLRNRLSKAIGHLEKVKQMVEEDQDSCDVLMQLSAVKSALNNAGKYILKEYITNQLIDAVENKEFFEIDDLNKAIDYFIK